MTSLPSQNKLRESEKQIHSMDSRWYTNKYHDRNPQGWKRTHPNCFTQTPRSSETPTNGILIIESPERQKEIISYHEDEQWNASLKSDNKKSHGQTKKGHQKNPTNRHQKYQPQQKQSIRFNGGHLPHSYPHLSMTGDGTWTDQQKRISTRVKSTFSLSS